MPPDSSKTVPDANRPTEPAFRKPPIDDPTMPEVDEAKNEAKRLRDASTEAMGEWVRYRTRKPNPARQHPGDPANYDPDLDTGLRDKSEQARRAAEHATARYLEMIKNYVHTPKGPGPGGCPPNCAGSAPSSPGSKRASGVTTVQEIIESSVKK